MTERLRFRMLRPTRLTWAAAAAIAVIIGGCAAFLLGRYVSLPSILPVRFNRLNRPIGWQFKTYPRVFLPVFVQMTLTIVLGTISSLLMSRAQPSEDGRIFDPTAASSDPIGSGLRTGGSGLRTGVSPGPVSASLAAGDAAASVAAEAIALVALIWVSFQAYAALALVAMWQRGRGDLGLWYTFATAIGIVLSIVVGLRAQARFGRPTARPFVPEHWRFGQLYRNPDDPALFVPTRDGSHWTLNFGRPVAAALIGFCVVLGIVVPSTILHLLLR